MTTKKINAAIAHLGIEIVRGYGYQYFLDLKTGYQVGESVMVCYLYHCTLEEWVSYAENAVKQEAHK